MAKANKSSRLNKLEQLVEKQAEQIATLTNLVGQVAGDQTKKASSKEDGKRGKYLSKRKPSSSRKTSRTSKTGTKSQAKKEKGKQKPKVSVKYADLPEFILRMNWKRFESYFGTKVPKKAEDWLELPSDAWKLFKEVEVTSKGGGRRSRWYFSRRSLENIRFRQLGIATHQQRRAMSKADRKKAISFLSGMQKANTKAKKSKTSSKGKKLSEKIVKARAKALGNSNRRIGVKIRQLREL